MPCFLVSYDIKKPSVLQKISKRLQNDGLERILKSVFLGTLSSLTYKKLQTWVTQILEKEEDLGYVIIIPIAARQIDCLEVYGELDLDKEMLKGMRHTLIC